ncbi:MAG TPA: hypothetical protein VFE62_01095 [Gemmataceae bacterium]|nr:hypothetical protein [Gemmataceae bacterium]
MKRGMLRLALFATVIATLALLFGSTTSAQDPNLPPSYGAVALKAGFLPDPVVVNVVAGGMIHTNLGGVNAYVARNPDFRVYYSAGNNPLTFFVRSASDTTLLINLPNGTWIADDDSDGNLNPRIRLPNPPSGRYDIWVGTFAPATAPAVLFVTERR